jgi:DNA polymerase
MGIDFHEFEQSEFYEYCAQDVRSTVALLDALPADYLTDKEQKIWLMTQEMNLTGLPVDIDEITRVHDYVDGFVAELSHRVVELSEGQVHKVTQVAKLKDWINSKGVYAADMRADTVVNLLKLDTLPDDVREMLELRQTLGRSSTAKFKKLIKLHYKGRIYDNLRYYGTSTGRWSGMGFQVHNLPRAHVKDPEKMIEKFLNFEPVEDPVNVAKALIRPMIKAPEGKVLVVSDYSAIENCILAWVAREDPALDLIESGKSSYLDMAAFMRNMTYEEMERAYRAKEDIAVFNRWLGKIIVLGCGYQMGAARFQVTAEAWGQEISLGLAKRAVDAYRRKHPMIKRFWSRVMSCAIAAVANTGQAYMYNRCIFKVVQDRTQRPWLILTLPSMRKLFYAEPRMSTSRYGDVVRHKGIDPYSKKWTWLSLTPGRITENIVQALARDIMAHGMLNVRDNMKEVELMASVHDEALGLADEDKADLDRFNELLCELPEWAKTPRHLPLKAEGYIAQRYKKG